MAKAISSRRVCAMFLVISILATMLCGMSIEVQAANSSNYQIVTNYTQLTGTTTEFKITGNMLTHKQITVEGVFNFPTAFPKAVKNWWTTNTKFNVWVYNKNGKLYKFYNGVKSGTKISLPIGKNSYSVCVMPTVSSGWSSFKSTDKSTEGYLSKSLAFAQYRLKGI